MAMLILLNQQIHAQTDIPHNYHWLLRLPPYFWSRMHLYLAYSQILGLSQLSSEFAAVAVESYLPWSVRHRTVAPVESQSPKRETRACYFCFRIKGLDKFQFHQTMASYARVIQRDVFTGQRILEVTSAPSPGQHTGIVQPPSAPVSPIGMVLGMGANAYMYGAAMGSTAGFSVGDIPGGGGIPGMGSPLSPAVDPLVLHRVYQQWRPQAPGAEAGQIESIRPYCIDCALKTGLASPGDLLELSTGEHIWVCACQVARNNGDNQRCPRCHMAPVYRSPARR